MSSEQTNGHIKSIGEIPKWYNLSLSCGCNGENQLIKIENATWR